MHIVTHLSPKYQAMRNSENGWTEHEAGMVQPKAVAFVAAMLAGMAVFELLERLRSVGTSMRADRWLADG